MRRLFVTICGLAAWGLAVAGMFFAIGSGRAVALQKSIGLGGASPWPVVVLSVTVLVAGLSALDNLVTRAVDRPRLRTTPDVLSLKSIAIICGLGLLASLCAAIYGLDLSEVSFH